MADTGRRDLPSPDDIGLPNGPLSFVSAVTHDALLDDLAAAREALRRIDALPKRWGAPLAHEPFDEMGAAAWAAVGSEAHLIAHRALGGSVESARALLAPNQDAEDVEPTLGEQTGPAPG